MSVQFRRRSKSSGQLTGQGTVAILADAHYPFADPLALTLTYQVLSQVPLDGILLLGDIVDFAAFSTFLVPPGLKDVRSDIRSAQGFFQTLRSLFPSPWIVYLEGNHEYRLKRYLLQKAEQLWGLEGLTVPNLLNLTHYRIAYLESDEEAPLGSEPRYAYLRWGDFILTHGDRLSSSRTVNIARNVSLTTFSSYLIGHFHRFDMFLHTTPQGTQVQAYVVGCLCPPHVHYSGRYVWQQGIALVHGTKQGIFVELLPYRRQGKMLCCFFRGEVYSVQPNEVLS